MLIISDLIRNNFNSHQQNSILYSNPLSSQLHRSRRLQAVNILISIKHLNKIIIYFLILGFCLSFTECLWFFAIFYSKMVWRGCQDQSILSFLVGYWNCSRISKKIALFLIVLSRVWLIVIISLFSYSIALAYLFLSVNSVMQF